MPSHENIHINIVEIRHPAGTWQRQVDSLNDYIHGTVCDNTGQDVSFSLQAKDIETWAAQHDGVEAAYATLTLPPVSLQMLFDNPGFRKEVNLGAVCETYRLFQETKASGSDGTIFTVDDVREALDESGEDRWNDLEGDAREEFLNEYWHRFTDKIDDRLAERGNLHIETMISMELDEALDEFEANRTTPTL